MAFVVETHSCLVVTLRSVKDKKEEKSAGKHERTERHLISWVEE
jgi:hypothetical protein